MNDTLKPLVMTDEELESRMDAFFMTEFGRTFREPTSTPEMQPVDTWEAIMGDFKSLFDASKPGHA